MSLAKSAATGPPRRPAPAEAGANLLVHDLKNLACRLATLCQNLGQRYDDPLFKATALDVLDDTALHLHRLAKDLRDHEGRVVVKLRVDLSKVLREALRDSRPDLSGGIQLVERYGDLPPIWGDAYLLRRAFACAIENSLEAMKGCGVLSIFTARIRRRDRTRLLAEITDTGPGMSESFLRRRLFRPFSSTKKDGLGLGVYTIRQVAALHGANLRILSGEGLGTCVRFYFPDSER